MRNSRHIRFPKKGANRTIKRMYRHSLKNIKNHPIPSIGILTLGAGLLSGVYMFLRARRD